MSKSLALTNIDLTRVYLARSQPLRETSLCLMARLVTDLTPSILNNPQIKNYFPKDYGIYLVTISWIWSFCESVSFFGFKPSEPTHKISATWLRCEDEIFSMTVLFPQYFNKLVWDWNSKIRIKRTHFHDGIVKKVHLHSDYTYSLAIHNSIFKSC